MIIYSILSICSIIILIIVLSPIRLKLDSSPVCNITWLFVKVRIRSKSGRIDKDIRIFNFTPTASKSKPLKEKPKKEKKPPKKKTKKKQIKFSFDLFKQLIQEKAVNKTLHLIFQFLKRCIRSIRIKIFKLNIGTNDYYLQGLIFGIFGAFPTTENFQLNGNFQEINDLELECSISIWRLLLAILVLLLRLPYFRAIFLYRRILVQHT